MVAVTDRWIDAGEGTSEAVWLAWDGLKNLPRATVDTLLPQPCRAVVVAPHPDDEILAAGGLLALHAARGGHGRVVAVTDGGASHPDSTVWPRERLVRERPLESRKALAELGLENRAFTVERLHLPDGEVAAYRNKLAERLWRQLHPSDVLITTWRRDGHPDHEATAEACAMAAHHSGARLIECPVWAWHWAQPCDRRIPWDRAQRVDLGVETVRRKQAAVCAFDSQLQADPSTGHDPILRRSTVARCDRPFEIMFT